MNRRGFIDRFALPYHREVFGKKPCLQFANDAPLMIDNATTFEQLAMLLASHDQRYLADGFVITEHGRYVSFGTGESLRAVTEMRIEAARYANPLTFLPGNIPISAHIDRLLQRDAGFHACYVDLNQFKPFNDQYGYWQGDEVLKFAATVLAGVCDPARLSRARRRRRFPRAVPACRLARTRRRRDRPLQRRRAALLQADRQAGGLHGEDRHGNPAFFGFVTMAIGAVGVAAARTARNATAATRSRRSPRSRSGARNSSRMPRSSTSMRAAPRAIAANRRPWQSAERRAIAACRHGGARCGDGARSPARQPDR